MHCFSNFDAMLTLFSDKYCYKVVLYVGCEILQSSMILYQSLLFIVTAMNDIYVINGNCSNSFSL